MASSRKRDIILNTRNISTQEFENEELEYRSYKEQLRRIVINDIDNKIKTMQILHHIREKKLYFLDGYKRFEDFLSEFIISRSQAFLYLKIYKKVLDGSIKIEDIKQKGFKGVYRDIVSLAIKSKSSKQNPVKPLRFQLKSQDSYDFYKKNAKFTSFLMDKIFSSKKDLIEELMKEFKTLKGE
ncbi:chromosome replication/partitioning protein [Borrelia miyamotoi]|uniref:Chromosome replication/partitioning protein n=1 Tax=Borrelia miyamotoi TaxID=47466 RepID=A0AAQ2WXS7_9SPIR|nr:chromosome replication/partitioning protein [Borrelia miyamotoi]AOW96086.1 permease [Borrelia miyamotoi]QTL84205.1 chromosome replication/partitioning protein [Borrelia miyamotoi]WAZ85852.1 chromosome replication/partitioning protein [Borrelia miyamotoi]WAZ91634.1 chromosome replication/partitioning protein [Borrelia miyamotoi]WAZ92926.1 chromosome replication/partitioning protein [Borrelia miyamotoi]